MLFAAVRDHLAVDLGARARRPTTGAPVLHRRPGAGPLDLIPTSEFRPMPAVLPLTTVAAGLRSGSAWTAA